MLFPAAVIFLLLFAGVAMLDGLYYHFYRYRLFEHPSSLHEHRLHTIRAAIFPFLVFLLFATNTGGWLLWATAALIAIDFGVEIADVICEKASRADLGGLSPGEYTTHALAITTHVAAFTLALAAKPLAAWHLDAPAFLAAPNPIPARVIAWVIIGGAIGIAALHMVLSRGEHGSEDRGSPEPA